MKKDIPQALHSILEVKDLKNFVEKGTTNFKTPDFLRQVNMKKTWLHNKTKVATGSHNLYSQF